MASTKSVRFAEVEDIFSEWYLNCRENGTRKQTQEVSSMFDRFQLAVQMDDVDSVQQFISEDPQLAFKCGHTGNFTILHMAAKYGAGVLLQTCLNQSMSSSLPTMIVDVPSNDADQYSPLYFAIREGHAGAVDILLQHGAAVTESLSSYNQSAFLVATMHVQPSVLQLLIDKHQPDESELFPCLKMLIRCPHLKKNPRYLKVFQVLLDHTHLDRNIGVQCVMDVVSYGGPVQSLALLQAAGVDLNEGDVAVRLLQSSVNYLRFDVLEFCMDFITDQQFLNTALKYSIQKGHLHAVKCLVHHGADLHQTVTWPEHPRHNISLLNFAMTCWRLELLPYLIDQGIKPTDVSLNILLEKMVWETNRYIRYDTAWRRWGELISRRHLWTQYIMSSLLSYRPQLIDEDWNGIYLTPLELAIRGSHICLVVKLIQYGVSLDGTDVRAFAVLLETLREVNLQSQWRACATMLIIIRASIKLQQLPKSFGGSILLRIAQGCHLAYSTNPRSLQELCRATIVYTLRGRAWPAVPQLGLPLRLQRYLRYEEIMPDITECLCPESSDCYDPNSDQCACLSFMLWKQNEN